MATVTVQLSEYLKARAEAQASLAGFDSVDAYLASLIESDIAEPHAGAPAHLSPRTRGELEAMLKAGMESPSREMTAEDWKDIRRQVEASIAGGGPA